MSLKPRRAQIATPHAPSRAIIADTPEAKSDEPPQKHLSAVTFQPAPRLTAGDPVGVIAPASSFDRASFEAGLAVLSARYRPEYDAGLFAKERYLAGDDARRLSELMTALARAAAQGAVLRPRRLRRDAAAGAPAAGSAPGGAQTAGWLLRHHRPAPVACLPRLDQHPRAGPHPARAAPRGHPRAAVRAAGIARPGGAPVRHRYLCRRRG